MQIDRIASIITAAGSAGHEALLEPEGFKLLQLLEIDYPNYSFVEGPDRFNSADLAGLAGDRVVVKVVSPEIPHKSDVGGVVTVPREASAVRATIEEMERAFADRDVRGYLIQERVNYDPALGSELLFGVRWTDDFGPVVVFGAGGVYSEFLARNFHPGRELALATPAGLDETGIGARLEDVAITSLVTGRLRGQAPRIELEALVSTFAKFAELARQAVPDLIYELEVNPFVVTDGQLVALDVLVRRGRTPPTPRRPRPSQKLARLLRPSSIALVGVSERMNPGRVILDNILRAGFDPDRVYVVKPDEESIAGCRCYPDIASLPASCDLLVLAVAAEQVPDLLAQSIDARKAESVIVIPGGMDETEGGDAVAARIETLIDQARASEAGDGGPVINGGNCLGVRSEPGGYDATFIPKYKLPPDERSHQVALISASGAFGVAKTSKFGFNPRFSISIGNQIDLTIGDYLDYLKDDPGCEIFAIYAEGFKPLDGLAFLEAAREITSSGRTVILYRAGRTAEGARASASHTAAIAGDYAVTRELARAAGVLVCETLEEFDDLVKLAALLGSKPVAGLRLGALSNAGFECVAMADHLGDLELAHYGSATIAALRRLLERQRLAEIVDVRNPADVTPILDDAAFAEAARIVLCDENVDVGLIGCVPLTPALETLSTADSHREDVSSGASVARRLIELEGAIEKPWVAVVDGGAMFDDMANLLETNGVPTFRSADRALRALGRYCRERTRSGQPSSC